MLCNVVPNGSRSCRWHSVGDELMLATQRRVFITHIIRINGRGIQQVVTYNENLQGYNLLRGTLGLPIILLFSRVDFASYAPGGCRYECVLCGSIDKVSPQS
jgi:hypothetical protein